jgi:adenine deaminase
MAINKLIDTKGGIAAVDGDKVSVLELPVAGLMSMEEGETVARQYQQMNDIAKHLGSPLKAPFMTLSFLSLLVIPSLKLGDKGLFDVNSFSFTSLFE